MHPIHRKRVLRGGFIAPLITGIASAIAPQIFGKIFGNGRRKKSSGYGKRKRRGGSNRLKKAFGELINSGPLP